MIFCLQNAIICILDSLDATKYAGQFQLDLKRSRLSLVVRE